MLSFYSPAKHYRIALTTNIEETMNYIKNKCQKSHIYGKPIIHIKCDKYSVLLLTQAASQSPLQKDNTAN